MLHESCDIVADAGGWTCRTCRAHWRVSFQPDACADDRAAQPTQADTDRAAWIVVAILVAVATACVVGAALAP